MSIYTKLGIWRHGGAEYIPESWPMPIFVNGKLLSPILFVLDYLAYEHHLHLPEDPLADPRSNYEDSLVQFVHNFFNPFCHPGSRETIWLRPRILTVLSALLVADWDILSQALTRHLEVEDGRKTLELLRSELYSLLEAIQDSDLTVWGAPESDSELDSLRQIVKNIDPNVVEKYFLLPHMKNAMTFHTKTGTFAECWEELHKAEAIFNSRNS